MNKNSYKPDLIVSTSLLLYKVERRQPHEVEHVEQHEMAYMEHRTQWATPQQQQQLMMQMTPATHQLIHGSPPGTHQLIQVGHRDESDDGYRTNSSSSSCSDGQSPHSQMASESPPPGKIFFLRYRVLLLKLLPSEAMKCSSLLDIYKYTSCVGNKKEKN